MGDDIRANATQSRPIFLLAHPVSYRHVKAVCHCIQGTVESLSGSTVTLLRPSRVEDVSVPPGSVVLVIGDPYPGFTRDPSSFFEFVNFSLLYNVHRRLSMNWAARRWIAKKRREFLRKASGYDLVVDFYSEQTPLIERALRGSPTMVMPFLVDAIREVEAAESLEEREWDVCVVGAPTPRRERVYAQLRERGCTLSPFHTDALGSIVAKSRITVNLHAYDCSNFEAPRIVETLGLGGCLVTEPCHGIEKMFPGDCYHLAPYAQMARKVAELLQAPGRIRQTGQAARRYVAEEHSRKAASSWASILDAIAERLTRATFSLS